jgi:hypothetical protein
MAEPLMPSFEGVGGPMEEGMVYVMFSNDATTKSVLNLNSVWRAFWVVAPELKYHQIDAFLISEVFKNRDWERYFREPIFHNPSEDRWHQEIHLKEIDMVMDGTWETGYTLEFEDRLNHIAGDLKFSRLTPKSALVYYNGRDLETRVLIQRFYDLFGLQVEGEIEVDNQTIAVKNGRGILEHGVGVFSTMSFFNWHWMNLQFDQGSIHLFSHPLSDGRRGAIKAGEGAIVLDGEWTHLLKDDFTITPLDYLIDREKGIQIPRAWRVVANPSKGKQPVLDLKVELTAYETWTAGGAGFSKQYIDYMIKAEGTWGGIKIRGKGTMEFMCDAMCDL